MTGDEPREARAPLTRRNALRGGVLLASGLALGGRTITAEAAAPEPGTAPTPSPVDRHRPTIGFVLTSEQFGGPELVELAVAAEQAGFDAVWTSDHFMPWQDNEGHAVQATVLLGALTQRTRRIRIGTGVTCPIYRYHPAIVAQTFATLATFAPGRVFLGCGKGEALNEKAATGRWDGHAGRSDRWREAIETIRALWSGHWVDHDGRHYRVNGKLYDAPPEPIPLYMAASGTKSIGMAGRFGDGWITSAKDAMSAEKRKAFADAVVASGRDPNDVPVIAETWVVVGGTREAEEAATRWRFIPQAFTTYFTNPDPRAIQRDAAASIPLRSVYQDWAVSEDPAVHVAAIRRLLDGGTRQVFIHSGQQDQRRVIEFYGRQVLPQLRAA